MGKIVKEAGPMGKPCRGTTHEAKSCMGKKCPTQDCVWNEWEDWGGCTCTCGGGSMRRQRTVLKAPRGGGKLCPNKTKDEVAPCNTQSCEACIDGKWGEWSLGSACSAT